MATALGYSVRRFDFPLGDVPGMSSDEVVEIHAGQIREETRALVFPHIDNIVGLGFSQNGLYYAAWDGTAVEIWIGSTGAEAGAIDLSAAATNVRARILFTVTT